MREISDAEIREVVQRVLNQTLGISSQSINNKDLVVSQAEAAKKDAQPSGRRTVIIGADHGGFELKELLKKELSSLGFDVVDAGTHNKEAVDYPDFAHSVARLVASGQAWRGIVIDGAGIGSCIVANKIPGVRAGMAYDYSSAVNSREHNDTNVLTLGAGLIGVNLASQIVRTWLSTEFGGGRHARRVDKITEIEKQYAK